MEYMSKCPEFHNRAADHPIEMLILQRWSPRAMSGEVIRREELLTVLEAARWAPSAHNVQPWRFLYALRGDAWWPSFLSMLNASHRPWIEKAGALLIIVSDKKNDHEKDGASRTFSFDAGAACQNACLQATSLGLVSHVVQIMDKDSVRRAAGIPDDYSIELGLVLGRHGQRSDLAPEYRAKEEPRLRRPLSDIVFEGTFASEHHRC